MLTDSDDYEDYESNSSPGDAMSEGDYAFENQGQSSTRQAAFAVYDEAELKDRQKKALDVVTSVLSIDASDAARVLRECKWDANRANEEWFTDMDGVRDRIGLLEEAPQTTKGNEEKEVCSICFDEHRISGMCAAPCGHHFCKDCWRSYLHNAIESGPSSLNLRCPMPECRAAVPQQVFTHVADAAHAEKHRRYAVRSFVEDNRRLTWCPAPGCEHAVESLTDTGPAPLDVVCRCGSAFCFNCKEEAHRPVACNTVRQWLIKNSAESENLNWILAHTKQCPKCKRPIEKNQGCMHMTCSQCRFEFCWLCQGAWADHGERTGGFYACNRFETAQKAGEYDDDARKRDQARNALERYMHYYQRWAENDSSKHAARKEAQNAALVQLLELSEATATPTSQLKFICDAWDQVVDCRRILKWTYAYGYYIFGERGDAAAPAIPKEVLDHHQRFFEFNQGQAESYLEKLHGMAERELADLLDRLKPQPGAQPAQQEGAPELTRPEFSKFREILIGLTDVTRTHFRKLVEELEKGLTVMLHDYTIEDEAEAAPAATSSQAPEPAKSSKASGTSSKPRAAKRTRAATKGDAKLGRSPSPSSRPEAALEAEAGFWQCSGCTLANHDMSATACEVCETPRPAR